MTGKGSTSYNRHREKRTTHWLLTSWPRLSLLTVLVFLLGLVVSTPAFAQETPQTISAEIAGDATAGKNLFTGVTRLDGGGPPCIACHSIAGLGALGGGALGPNLTGAYTKIGDTMMIWPETSKTMKPIFGAKKLTQGEKDDLLAFFKSASLPQRSSQAVIQLGAAAAAGSVVVLGLAHLIWIRRNRNVRRKLVGRRVLPGA